MMKNDRGMTLVEVLAALVILGIVFIGFMTIFPQMSLFNAKTEDKLKTMNLAKQELSSIEYISDLEDKDSEAENLEEEASGKEIKRFEYDNEEDANSFYHYIIDFYVAPDLNGEEQGVSLHKIHIKVLKDDKKISETFGYIID